MKNRSFSGFIDADVRRKARPQAPYQQIGENQASRCILAAGGMAAHGRTARRGGLCYFLPDDLSFLGRTLYWPRGRTLGGSSSINGMIYICGNPIDYDGWQDTYGCDGWGYADLLPYFRRAEDQQRGESAFHGVDGPPVIQPAGD